MKVISKNFKAEIRTGDIVRTKDNSLWIVISAGNVSADLICINSTCGNKFGYISRDISKDGLSIFNGEIIINTEEEK